MHKVNENMTAWLFFFSGFFLVSGHIVYNIVKMKRYFSIGEGFFWRGGEKVGRQFFGCFKVFGLYIFLYPFFGLLEFRVIFHNSVVARLGNGGFPPFRIWGFVPRSAVPCFRLVSHCHLIYLENTEDTFIFSFPASRRKLLLTACDIMFYQTN